MNGVQYSQYRMEHDIARLLLAEKAVTLNVKEPYTYASGIRSPIYCDNRVLISNPVARAAVLDGFVELITHHSPHYDIIAGTAIAGIPWAAWLAQQLNKPLVYVRDKKDHGKQNTIEGRLEANSRVIVIEDLISTGKSSYAAVEELRNAKTEVIACLAIFTYELQKSKSTFSDCPLFTITRFSALIEEAQAQHYITGEEAMHILAWNKSPENWEKVIGGIGF